MAAPTHPLTSRQKAIAAAGAVALILGVVLLIWGLAPAKGFGAAGSAFGGGPVPDDLNEQINAALDGVIARAWASGLGLAMILGGVLSIKGGLTPKEKTVEERVQEELQARGATSTEPAAPATAAPAAIVAPPPAAQPTPAPATATGCPSCGAALIAGGRFCRTCGKV